MRNQRTGDLQPKRGAIAVNACKFWWEITCKRRHICACRKLCWQSWGMLTQMVPMISALWLVPTLTVVRDRWSPCITICADEMSYLKKKITQTGITNLDGNEPRHLKFLYLMLLPLFFCRLISKVPHPVLRSKHGYHIKLNTHTRRLAGLFLEDINWQGLKQLLGLLWTPKFSV